MKRILHLYLKYAMSLKKMTFQAMNWRKKLTGKFIWRVWIGLLCFGNILFWGIHPVTAITYITVEGPTGISFNIKFYDCGEAYYDGISAASFTQQERDAVVRAFQYYANTFTTLPADMDTTIEVGFQAETHFSGPGTIMHAADDFICINLSWRDELDFGYNTQITTIASENPRQDVNMTATIIHELGHCAGMLGNMSFDGFFQKIALINF